MANYRSSLLSAIITDETWKEFVEAWWKEHQASPVICRDLIGPADSIKLFDRLGKKLAPNGEQSKSVHLGKLITSRIGTPVTGFTIRVVDQSRSSAKTYMLQKT